jgi:Ala-tRNA(Pro) deacylase
MVHIPGKELAKTVVVNLDGMLVMAVLPASRQVNMERFRLVTEAASARTATEREFKHRFPDCEPGAMPPFGNLYNMRVYVDELLTRDEEIAFNAGTHRELIRLAYRDFARLVQPVIAKFAAGKPGSLRAAGG